VAVKVKICGVCTAEDARAAVGAGADFLGLNFWPGSPRHVDVARARAIAESVPGTPLVGVFVDAPRDLVERVAAEVGLAAVPFHRVDVAWGGEERRGRKDQGKVEECIRRAKTA